MIEQSFYRRPLPDDLVAFSGPEGRQLFAEALAAGTMEGYFALSEQFHTQVEPAFCGLGSLVVALNALGIDPGRLWKGPWRWFDESLLDCCVPLEVVQARGLTLAELGCLAECNGARAETVHAADVDAAAFRAAVLAASQTAQAPVVVAGYARQAIGQTGSGHFSPLGGYHAARDLVLVLDVARFKYPPHWVRLESLFAAMQSTDPASARSRGWVTLRSSRLERPLFLRLAVPARGWRPIVEVLASAVRSRDPAKTAVTWAEVLPQRAGLGELVAPLTSSLDAIAPEHRARIEALLGELRATDVYAAAARAVGTMDSAPGAGSLAPEVVALLALVLADEPRRELGGSLALEIDALRKQFSALGAFVTCGGAEPGCSTPSR